MEITKNIAISKIFTLFIFFTILIFFSSWQSAKAQIPQDEKRLFTVIDQTFIPRILGKDAKSSAEKMIEEELGFPVRIGSRLGKCPLIKAAIEFKPNVLIVSPITAPYLVSHHDYLPLAKSSEKMVPYILSLKEAPIMNVSELRDKRFATARKETTFAMITDYEISKYEGLANSVEILYMSQSQAFVELLNGDLHAVAMPAYLHIHIPEKHAAKLTHFVLPSEIPNSIALFHKESDPGQIERYKEYLLSLRAIGKISINFSEFTMTEMASLERKLGEIKSDYQTVNCEIN